MSPIKPENRDKYPPDWLKISLRVRAEAGQRCEECRLCNGAVGYRHRDGRFFRALPRVDRSIALRMLRDLNGPKAKLTKIVLTVHHIDGNPSNCDRSNLIALCQRCHLAADRKLRKARKLEESECPKSTT